MRQRNVRGFTLVETLIAAGLIAMSALSLVFVFTAARGANDTARRISFATLLAVDKMEHLRALPFDDAALEPSPPEALTADVPDYSDRPAAGYSRRWSITPLASNPAQAVVIEVLVRSQRGSADARLIAVKARKAG